MVQRLETAQVAVALLAVHTSAGQDRPPWGTRWPAAVRPRTVCTLSVRGTSGGRQGSGAREGDGRGRAAQRRRPGGKGHSLIGRGESGTLQGAVMWLILVPTPQGPHFLRMCAQSWKPE